eukprot:6492769-Amphidinium_carterae.6
MPSSLQDRNTRKSRKSAGSGAWRAFIRLRSWGQAGSPNLSLLAKAYRDAKVNRTAEFLMCCRVASVGKVQGKQLKHKSTSCFGIKGREVRRASMKQQKQGFWQRTRGLAVHERSSVLAAQGHMHRHSLRDAMTYGRAQERLATKQSREDIQKAADILREFESTTGKQQLNDLLSALPDLRDEKSLLTPVPVEMGTCFALSTGIDKTISKAAGWAASSRKTNVSQSLYQEWQSRHEPVEAHPSVHMPKDEKPHPCRLAGTCICTGEGILLRKLAGSIRASMKRACPGLAASNPLTSGNIVLQLLGESPSTQNDTRSQHHRQSLWLHVSAMYYSPYRPTYHELFAASRGEDGSDADPSNRRQLLKVGRPLCMCDSANCS